MISKNVAISPKVAEMIITLYYNTEYENRIVRIFEIYIKNSKFKFSYNISMMVLRILAKSKGVKPSIAVEIASLIEHNTTFNEHMALSRLQIALNNDIENFESIDSKFSNLLTISEHYINLKARFIAKVTFLF